MPMDARKHLIIIKGKDQTDSVAGFQFHDGKCEVVYTSAPNKTYSFQSSNVEILPLQKKIDPARVIVTVNGQTISGIDEILDFGGYYRIVRNGKRDLSFRRSEVQFQQNCLTDGKNQETFQYFKETAAAISLVAENGINILSMQYDKIQQVSEDTVLASYLAPQKDVKMPQMPEAVIYPFGLNQSQKLAVERALSSKISIIQGPPGTGKTQTILNIIANVVRSGKTVAVVSNNNSATRNVVEKLEKKNSAFLTAFLGSLANKEKFLDAQTVTCRRRAWTSCPHRSFLRFGWSLNSTRNTKPDWVFCKSSPSCSASIVMHSNYSFILRNWSFPICRVSFIR